MMVGSCGLIVWICWPLINRLGTRKSRSDSACLSCGYNLTGNLSGICPECGRAFPAVARPALRTPDQIAKTLDAMDSSGPSEN
jgi:predicted amidophosphoribosyltransferase